jgi:hypothetical protein
MPGEGEVFDGTGIKLLHIDDLDEWHIMPIIKRMIRTGKKTGVTDRSAIVLHVCGELVRCDVPDALIYGIITTKRWGISGHCLGEKDTDRAAKRALARAHKDSPSNGDKLRAMNRDHCVLEQEGGKCRVLSWEASEIDSTRERVVLQSFTDFHNRYCHKSIFFWNEKKGQWQGSPLGKFWTGHPNRRQYKALRFDPKQSPEFDGYLNLWRGFTVEPTAGDWSLFRKHIERIGGGKHEYIIKWMAWGFQNPDKPAEVALTIRGERGVGKGVIGRTFVKVFGQHGLHVFSSGLLIGQFNAHMRDCCALCADEATETGDRQGEAKIKGCITEPELPIEGKGKDLTVVVNRLKVVVCGNSTWTVPAGVKERRFAIYDAPSDHIAPEYFKALYHELDHGGREAMLHDLLKLDLGDWHPRNDVPNTKALRAQQALGDTDELQWLLGILEDGMIRAVKPGNKFAPARTYLSGDRRWSITNVMRESAPGLAKVSNQRLTAFLKEWGFKPWRSGDDTGWTAPSLIALRKQWEARVRPTEWDDDGVEDWRDRVETGFGMTSEDREALDRQQQFGLKQGTGR